MPGASNVLQEYLVSLGVEVDQKSMNTMNQFLGKTQSAMKLFAGAMVVGATALTKFMVSQSKYALELERTAKAEKKAVEAVRAHETALKAMGKTMDEIKKDKTLKGWYDNLVKVNRAMELPNSDRYMTVIKDITSGWYGLKSTIQYAGYWIHNSILKHLQRPLQRIKKGIEDFQHKLQINMPSWSEKVGRGVEIFTRFLEAAVDAGAAVIKFLGNLPKELYIAGLAFTGLWKAMHGNPIMLILTGLTAILALIDDYKTWERGGMSYFDWGDMTGDLKGVEKLGNEIGEKISTGIDSAADIVTNLAGKMADAITKFNWGPIANSIINGIGSAIKAIGTIGAALLEGITEYIGTEEFKTSLETALENATEGITVFINAAADLAIALIDALAQPEVISAFLDAGKAILRGILFGLAEVGTTVAENILKAVVGEEEFAKYKQTTDAAGVVLSGNVKAYDDNGNEMRPGDILSIAKNDPEKFSNIVSSDDNADWLSFIAAVDSRVGTDSSVFDSYMGTTVPDQMRPQMGFFSQEYKKYSEFAEMYNAAVAGRDKGAYSTAMASMKVFREGYDNGIRGDELTAYVEQNAPQRAMEIMAQIVPPDNAEEAHDSAQAAMDQQGSVKIRTEYDSETPRGAGRYSDGSHAQGGIISRRGMYELGEEGKEAVIPLTKPHRAMALLKEIMPQLSAKLGGALDSIGITPGMDVSKLGGGLGPQNAAQVVNQTTITNHFNITVQGNQPEGIGRRIGMTAANIVTRYLK